MNYYYFFFNQILVTSDYIGLGFIVRKLKWFDCASLEANLK